MKQIKYLILLVVGSPMMLTSCMDNYETLPADEFTTDYLFSTTDSLGKQARQYLNTIYDIMENGHNRVGGDYLDAASDDAISIDMDGEPDVLRLVTGRYTASNGVGSDMRWGQYYTGIRKVNILISGIDRVPFRATYKNAVGQIRPLGVTFKAEARFLRAWFYFQLLRRYGGVPIVGDRVFNINDDVELPRNTFGECVDYIVNELDDIQDSLRSVGTMSNVSEFGHAPTKQACQALKSRVLLYAASPLFNGQTLEAGNELVGYATYDAARWKRAADAARDLIEGEGHKGKDSLTLTEDVRNVFLNFYDYGANPELIFFRQGGNNTSIENSNGPLGFTGPRMGNGRTCPTQNLVDAFPMADGRMPGDSPLYPYSDADPYSNRDPRLDKTILHNGSQWLGGKLATWQGGTNNPANGTDYSLTSYYMCKFMGQFADKSEYSSVIHVWVMFRYAEILLNFAEAENESVGPTSEVYDALYLLRKRAGIKKGTVSGYSYGLKDNMTQAEMREAIHNERRIELAFEEHRYYDIRRWRIAEDVFAKPLQGMQVVESSGTTTYTRVNVLKANFAARNYLYPIPFSEVNKNRNMVQNPNWK
ncbi:RagB/SusD family nutrient uptake outer membrane protein [Prevotella sp. E13-17]|uniref:RagB/SusD family nutrient uptake outer membrane protein n=1 Tax=Prevotella sp. E13-17 TaxID=2913616 RepID=UPI001ED9F360|nr:RagB/SusD family nutrient uptake outer membrane protein [Prevotella sp. E13-17]UKK51049.1 RagB/SusD family nutrient uptake outer membrane protein [Prevotella sp. E13-17]